MDNIKAPSGAFYKYGGNDCPMLEPPQIIYKLKKLLSQEFITQLKSLKIAA